MQGPLYYLLDLGGRSTAGPLVKLPSQTEPEVGVITDSLALMKIPSLFTQLDHSASDATTHALKGGGTGDSGNY